jgi:hypothetical protein
VHIADLSALLLIYAFPERTTSMCCFPFGCALFSDALSVSAGQMGSIQGEELCVSTLT